MENIFNLFVSRTPFWLGRKRLFSFQLFQWYFLSEKRNCSSEKVNTSIFYHALKDQG